MQVVFLRMLIPFPNGLVEARSPIVGRLPVALIVVLGGPPDVPVSFWIVLRGARLLEPLVLVASVVDDEITPDSHPSIVTALDQGVHVFHSSVGRMNGFVVADVVAHV